MWFPRSLASLRRGLRIIAAPVKGDSGRGGHFIQAFRGYGSQNRVFLMGRVFRQPGFGAAMREDSLRRDLLDLYLLGDMVRADDLDGAVALMDLPSTRDNSTASLYTFLAGALRDSGERGQSIRFYRLALQQSPGDMTARSTLEEWSVGYTDITDIVPQPRIDPRVPRRYQGVYSSAPTGDITITEEDGLLYCELNANRSQFHPLSNSELYLLGSDARCRFQMTENGRNNGITITQGGAQVFAERL